MHPYTYNIKRKFFFSKVRLYCAYVRGNFLLTCVGRTVSRLRGIDILLAAPPAAPRRPLASHHPPRQHYGPEPARYGRGGKHFPDIECNKKNIPTGHFTKKFSSQLSR